MTSDHVRPCLSTSGPLELLLRLRLICAKTSAATSLRTLLTSLATIVLVIVVTGVWSVLGISRRATTREDQNLKAIVTERWQIPSQMPFAYANTLTDGRPANPGDVSPDDSMTWTFYGGTLDSKQSHAARTASSSSAMEPRKLHDHDGRPRQPARRADGRARATDKL